MTSKLGIGVEVTIKFIEAVVGKDHSTASKNEDRKTYSTAVNIIITDDEINRAIKHDEPWSTSTFISTSDEPSSYFNEPTASFGRPRTPRFIKNLLNEAKLTVLNQIELAKYTPLKEEEIKKLKETYKKIDELSKTCIKINPDEKKQFNELKQMNKSSRESVDSSFSQVLDSLEKEIKDLRNTENPEKLQGKGTGLGLQNFKIRKKTVKRAEKKLVRLLSEKIEYNNERLKSLKDIVYSKDNIKNAMRYSRENIQDEILNLITTIENDNAKFISRKEEVSNIISLRESIVMESNNITDLNDQLEKLRTDISGCAKADSLEDETPRWLLNQKKEIEIKLFTKISNVKDNIKKFQDALSKNPDINKNELSRVSKKNEEMGKFEENLTNSIAKEQEIANGKLKMRADEAPLIKITDEFAKDIDQLEIGFENKSGVDREDILSKMESRLKRYKSDFESMREVIENIKKSAKTLNIESHALARHVAMVDLVKEFCESMNKTNEASKVATACRILRELCKHGSKISIRLLKKILKIIAFSSFTVGVLCKLKIEELFEADKAHLGVIKKTLDKYTDIVNQTKISMAYVKNVNEHFPNEPPISISPEIIAKYNLACENLEDLKKIYNKFEKCLIFRTDSRVEQGIEFGNKIIEDSPELKKLLTDSERITILEILKNPWTSKQVMEEYKEKYIETDQHPKCFKQLANAGIHFDKIAESILPEPLNFREEYAGHMGISAQLRLLDATIVHDSNKILEVQLDVEKRIEKFEEKTKRDNEDRCCKFIIGNTKEYTFMKEAGRIQNEEYAKSKKLEKDKAERHAEIIRLVREKQQGLQISDFPL